MNTSHIVPDSFIEVAESYGIAGYDRQRIVELYSLGVPENMLRQIFGEVPAPEVFEEFYRALSQRASEAKVYNGIVQCLRAVNEKSIKQSVFTGASQRSANIILGRMTLIEQFDFVLGGDDHPPKPDPGGLLAVLDFFGAKPSRAAYVGDSPSDMQAAAAIGVRSIRAGWGHLYHSDGMGDYRAEAPHELWAR